MLSIVVTDAGCFALAEEWRILWERCPGACPFQHPAWILPWWRVFGTGLPRIATLREGGRLVGLSALYVLAESGGRKLLPMGAGVTDYQDLLLAPEQPAGAAAVLLGLALAQARTDEVTVCDLIDLPPDALLRKAAAPSGWNETAFVSQACPVLALPNSIQDLPAAVPAGKLRDLRQARHRAERIGGNHDEIATTDTVAALLEKLQELHALRWLDDPAFWRFLHLAAPGLLRAGLLRLQVLHLGGAVAAAYFTLLGDGMVLFYLSGFDPAFARQSPGTLLMGAMIAQATAEGRRELHFLRGGEGYKHAWGAQDRHNADRRLVPA